MIKIEIDKKTGSPAVVMAGGNVKEMLLELSVAVRAIHQQMEQVDPMGAMLFKKAVQIGFAKEDGPVWGLNIPAKGFGMIMPGRGRERDDEA